MGSAFGSKGGKSSGTGKNGFPQGGNGGNIQPSTGLEGKRGFGNTQLPPDKKGLGRAELEGDPTLNKQNPSSDILPKNNILPKELKTLNIENTATSIGTGAFRNTTNLQGTITGGDSLITIGPLSFLSSGAIALGNLIAGNTQNIGAGSFMNCGVKGPIDLGLNIRTVGTDAFRNTEINALSITGNEFMTINSNAFRDCTNLTNIYLDVAPQVFSGKGHFKIGQGSNKTVVRVIEVDTTNNSGQIGLPQKKWLLRPSIPEEYTYTGPDLSDPNLPSIEYTGNITIQWEDSCQWVIYTTDNDPSSTEGVYYKAGIPNGIDYYDPNPEISYTDSNFGGDVRIRIPDRDAVEPPNSNIRMSVREEDFNEYNCGPFRAQTGFTGVIVSR